MYVYVVRNKINNCFYVGKRCALKTTSDFGKYYGSGVNIKKAIAEFGIENFSKTILEECTSKEELAKKELFWIKKLISEFGIEYCYNIQTEHNYVGRNKGFKQTKEHIDKRLKSAIKSGIYVFSEERRKKMSDFKKGKPSWNKGKKCNSLSESKKGVKNPQARSVINKSTGVIYGCISDAAKDNNIPPSTLWQYLSGKRINKTTLEFNIEAIR